MKIKTVEDLTRVIEQGPCAWPGGYPLYFITEDGGPMSFQAVKDERQQIEAAILDNCNDDGFKVVAVDVNWEDTGLYCDHTHEKIPSAYGDN
jgi:hypothetical protein